MDLTQGKNRNVPTRVHSLALSIIQLGLSCPSNLLVPHLLKSDAEILKRNVLKHLMNEVTNESAYVVIFN